MNRPELLCVSLVGMRLGARADRPACSLSSAGRMPRRRGALSPGVARHADRLDQPLHWRQPRRVFVNSMSDLFHEDVPLKFIWGVLGMGVKAPPPMYQILT